MILQLAWRNLWRNSSRSLIAMASVWCAVVFAIVLNSLQKGVFERLVANVVSFYSGYVQVHSAGYSAEQTLENSFIYTDSLRRAVESVKSVSSAAPRLEVFALASSGDKTRGCLTTGVVPEQEDRITHLKSKVTAGEYLTDSTQTVLVAEGLARRLNLGLGDTLILLSQGYYGTLAAGKFPIGGLLHFGSPELNDQVVFLSLKKAQEWLDAPDLATTLVIMPRNPEQSIQTAKQISDALPASFEVLPWQKIMPDIDEHIRVDSASMSIILGVLYLLIGFGIFAVLLMMFAERQREFGILVALGMRKSKLAVMLLLESIFMTLTGCLGGMLISLPIVWRLAEHPIRFGGDFAEIFERFGFEAVFPATVDPGIFLRQTIAVLIIALVLSLYPVVRVLSLKPLDAMRSG
ncbi:MAG TPA: ABC transporter permease [Saprospirales bacterium]|nr:ABC transporter permease [Saprospirales bacterium]